MGYYDIWYQYFEIFKYDFVLDKEFIIQTNCNILSLTVLHASDIYTPNKKVSFNPNPDA